MKMNRIMHLFVAVSLLVSTASLAMSSGSETVSKGSWWHRRKVDQTQVQSKGKTKSKSEKNADVSTTPKQPESPNWAYNYFDREFIERIVPHSRYVLVGTGFSESSLGKMNVNNQEKQKRAFALSVTQMMTIEQLQGKGKLIYLTTAPISDAYQQYLYRIFNQNNFRSLTDSEIDARYRSFKNRFVSTVYLTPKGRDRKAEDRTKYLSEKSNAYRRIKLPNELIQLVHDKYNSNTFVGLTAHFTGPYLENMAKQFGLPYLVNPAAQGHWIKKSKSRQSFRDAGVRHARGTYEPAFSVDALVNDMYDLLQEIPGKKIIMKLDQSAAGYGNRVMRFDDITSDMTEEQAKKIIRSRFDDREVFAESFLDRIAEEDGGAIIEEFLDCKNYASPASLFMINGENNVTVHYTYDQLLGGKDNMVYQGSLGPIRMPGNPEGDIESMSREVAMYLSTQGVRGNVGTDFVVCDDDTGTKRIAYAIENNVRMTGTSYPYYTARTILGEAMMKTKYMKSFDDVHIPQIDNNDIRRKVNHDFFTSFLKDNPLNLNVTTGVGCLVHNDTFRIGKVGISCIGDSTAEVTRLYDEFMKAINAYLTAHELVQLAERHK